MRAVPDVSVVAHVCSHDIAGLLLNRFNMTRPKRSDAIMQAKKRAAYYALRDNNVSYRDAAQQIGVTPSTAQTWDRLRPEYEVTPFDELRQHLQHCITHGHGAEVATAPRLYWRVRLNTPADGSQKWQTHHLIDYLVLPSGFAELGEEGDAMRAEYVHAALRRAGLVQQPDGSWVADPTREPVSM